MDELTIRHKGSFGEYLLGIPAMFFLGWFAGIFVIFLFNLRGEMALNLSFLGSALFLLLYLRDVQCMRNQRMLKLTNDGVTYQAYADEPETLTWEEITSAHSGSYKTEYRKPGAVRVSGAIDQMTRRLATLQVCTLVELPQWREYERA